ncbi:MAG: hypothetical protein D6698_12315 [Gammaproteobacteria bacterium]|nr:MAG: hypothetical protein D6698_12315 [Gammaproteobacteria bacterium]
MIAMILGLSLTMMASTTYASDDHQHNMDDHTHGMMSSHHHDDAMDDSHHKMGKGMQKASGMFLVKKSVDGYDVTFHVMKAKKGMEHGGSHHFMIKIEKGHEIVGNAMINSKVKYPDGKAQTKKMMKMGDWYMAGYDLKHEGKHQMMILFKTADGQKHKAGVYYPE